MSTHEASPEDDNYKSKTQIKNEMHALQALGEALLELPLPVYSTMPIPEELDNAIETARKIKSRPARKRQLQYIGKVMRQIDTEQLQQAYDDWTMGRKKLAQEHHQLEALRDALVAGEKDTLTQLIDEHPDCDIQQLRQLTRLAQQDLKQQKPPKNARKLFRLLKSIKGLE